MAEQKAHKYGEQGQTVNYVTKIVTNAEGKGLIGQPVAGGQIIPPQGGTGVVRPVGTPPPPQIGNN